MEAVDRPSELFLKGPGKVFNVSERTHIMGVLNVTPDSFSDGGKFKSLESAVERALEMDAEGADIIDVGGESSRPGALPVSLDEELARVMPVVEALSKRGFAVSVDTTKSAVARAALEGGAWMINDISALGSDPEMAGVVSGYGAALTLMHMRGSALTMQDNVEYDDLLGEVFDFLSERLSLAEKSGIERERIALDPGIGFGKSFDDNFVIIKRLGEFASIGRPIVVGPSRKAFIGDVSGGAPAERLSGTIAAVVASILNGAHIVRVHDVGEVRRAGMVADRIKGSGL